MRVPRVITAGILAACALGFGEAPAQTSPKPPIVNDPDLRIELVATLPEVEACTTVCSDPSGAIYVGNDPRDGRLNTKDPMCTIVRFDKAGAGRKRTVFAEGLYSPAGSAWYDGWLYVIHDPFMSRFKDTDGDGVADVREDLISNLGIEPNGGLNDHVVSGFTLGMDGYFYISVGDRGIYQAKSAKDGSSITIQGGGIARCRTDGSKLEVFSTGTRNHLQVNLDAEDNAFTRDNTDDGNGWWTRLTHHIEGGYYGYPHDYRQARNYGVVQPSEQTLSAIKQHSTGVELGENERFLPAMADFGGGSPTGGFCYLSDGLPERYRGKHFFSEWGKAGIFVTEVARDGASFRLVSDTKLVEPDKGGEFRPMQISVAADGSVFIADWGYGGWKSPRVAGAIWRLYWPEAKPAPRLKDESKARVGELIAALGHPDRDQRLRAEFAFAAREADALPKLVDVVRDERAAMLQRLHAYWAAVRLNERVESVQSQRTQKGQPGNPDVSAVTFDFRNLNLWILLEAPRELRCQALRGFEFGDDTLVVHPYFADTEFAGYFAAQLADKDPVIRLFTARMWARSYQSASDPKILGQHLIGPAILEWRIKDALSKGDLGSSGAALVSAVDDPDKWVRFTASWALANAEGLQVIAGHLRATNGRMSEGIWLTLEKASHPGAIQVLDAARQYPNPSVRTRAIEAIGRISYQPKPYDGHWWGTQPVKNPPPPHSVAWEGTPKAVAALNASLGDADTGVRLAVVKAFTEFVLSEDAPVSPGTNTPAGAVPSTAFREATLDGLRGRLTIESDPAVRRHLIAALGVQKDAKAMEVFTRIALDEKADPTLRDTAIGAVVNIGGVEAQRTIAQLAGADLSPEALLKVVEAAGSLKVTTAAGQLVSRLEHNDPGIRLAAVKSLAAIGPKAWTADTADGLIRLLDDKDSKIVVAAIEALNNAKAKAALPHFIALAEKNKFRRETVGAIASLGGPEVMPVLLNMLSDKNLRVRGEAAKALRKMRAQSWPLIEQRFASGEIPGEFQQEIRTYFESGVIANWKVVGPFENVWDAVHPPEADTLARSGVPELTKKYHNAEGKDVGWRDVSANADDGRIDLEAVFKTRAMVCAYAYAEIESAEEADAKLLVGSNDQIAIWLNGKPVHNIPAKRNFEADKDEVPVHLAAGRNHLFVKVGNLEGSWEFAARMPGLQDGRFVKSKEASPEEKQRAYALIAKADGSHLHAGDVARGEKLFHDPTGPIGGICASCHTVRGKGGQIGPDLSAIAANYKRADLITSILEPSKTIALGFEQVMLETNTGETISGSLRSEAGDVLTVVGADGQSRAVQKAAVKTRTDIRTSLMPPGLTLGLKPDEFVDLLAYLESLRGQ